MPVFIFINQPLHQAFEGMTIYPKRISLRPMAIEYPN